MLISLVQQKNQAQGTNPTIAFTSIAAGNTLIVQFETDTTSPPTFSDTAGNNWNIAVSFVWTDGFSTNRCVGVAYASNVIAGSTTITATSSATARIGAQEWSSGVANASLVLDRSATGTGSGTSFSTGSATTLFNAELLIGVFFDGNETGHGNFSAGAGYTGLTGFTNTLYSEYQIVSSTGSYNATATAVASAIWGGVLATFNIAPLPIFNMIVGRFNSANVLVGALTAPVWTSVNVTPITVNANTTADQNLMSVIIPANTLNSVGRTLKGRVKGLYSTPVASTATIEIKVQLGTLTLLDIVTSANPGTVTNNPFNLEFDITTQTAGASAKFETSGKLSIDLGAAVSSAGSTFLDTNTAVSSTLDITQNQTLQITVAFSAGSASNTCTQRQLVLNTVN